VAVGSRWQRPRCQLSGSLFPDIDLGGTNAASSLRTRVGLGLKISDVAFSGGGRNGSGDPANLDRGNVTGGSSWAASGQGGEGRDNDIVNDARSDWKFSLAGPSDDWFLFSRPLLLLVEREANASISLVDRWELPVP
jgi:hypothetical protein